MIMEKPVENHYAHVSLPQFVSQLRGETYASIEKLCESAGKQINRLQHLELQQATSQYTILCGNLVDEIAAFIQSRKEKFLPYIESLLEKAAANHDCTGCTGNCKLNHDMQLLELRLSQKNINSILYRLQLASLPLYADTIYPDAYRVLRNQMALIENNLTEVFFLEEHYLIPKIIEAQKSINAGS